MFVRALLRRRFALVLGLAAVATLASSVFAGHQVFQNRAVGGVAISVDGVLSVPAEADFRLLRDDVAKAVAKPEGDLNQPVELRMISLKGLEAAIRDARENGLGQLPDEVKFLAGLQRRAVCAAVPGGKRHCAGRTRRRVEGRRCGQCDWRNHRHACDSAR